MTAAGLDSSHRLAKGECSEAIVVTFDSMPAGFFLRQSILADQEDLKSALPPLVKSAEKATTSLVNNEAAPALDVKF